MAAVLDPYARKVAAVAKAAGAAASTVAGPTMSMDTGPKPTGVSSAAPTMTMDTGPKATGVTTNPPSTESDSEANMMAAGKARADAAAAAQAKQAVANKPAPQPWDDPNYQEPTPPPASAYAGQGAATVTADQSRTGPAYGALTQSTTPGGAGGTGAPPPPATPQKSSFDIQRAQVAADKIADEKRRMDAVERAYSNKGLGDSGILEAGKRNAAIDASRDASSRYNSIDMAESGQAYAAGEAEKNRQSTSSENALDRSANKEQFFAGLGQAKELALKGLDLQASSLALQEKGMTLEDARYYAGAAQAEKLALKGLSLQESAQELQRQGMSLQDAQFHAGLAQAKDLAEKGLTIDQQKLKLTEMGMTQEDARYYAGLAEQEKLADTQNAMDIKKGLIVDVMSKIPVDGTFIGTMNGLLKSLGLDTMIDQNTGEVTTEGNVIPLKGDIKAEGEVWKGTSQNAMENVASGVKGLLTDLFGSGSSNWTPTIESAKSDALRMGRRI